MAAVAALVLAGKHLGLVHAAQDGPVGVASAQGGIPPELPLQHNIGGRPQEGIPGVLLQAVVCSVSGPLWSDAQE